MIRRLEQGDEELLHEAWHWSDGAPTWFQDADKVFNQGELDAVAQLANRRKWFIGVFDERLQAVIIIEWRGHGQFEGHLMTRRRADIQEICHAAVQVTYDLLDCGLVEGYVWVAEKNLGVRKLCSTIGFLPDGVIMYRGAYRGRLIKWLRYSIQRESLLMENAA